MGEDEGQKEQIFVQMICLFTYFPQTVTDYEEKSTCNT